MEKGKLIVIEGTDGTGKATQTEALCQRLKKEGIPFASISFPQYDKNLFGRLLRESLDGKHGDFVRLDPKIASVIYACDRFESMEKIKNWIDNGKIVIADRYVTSNQIHQGGKIRGETERAKFLNWLSTMEYDILGITRPDAVIYLDVPYKINIEMIADRQSIKDTSDSDFDYLKNSKEAGSYMLAKESFWNRIACAPKGKLLSIEEIHEIVWDKVSNILK